MNPVLFNGTSKSVLHQFAPLEMLWKKDRLEISKEKENSDIAENVEMIKYPQAPHKLRIMAKLPCMLEDEQSRGAKNGPVKATV